MNYQEMTTKEIKSYYALKADNPNVSLAPSGTTEILNYHVIEYSDKPAYDVYTQRVEETAPINYMQTWSVVNLDQGEIDTIDAQNRTAYEGSMERTMKQSQMDALGDPAIHRYTQAMTKYYQMTEPYTQDELDFRGSAEDALAYQEDNAVKYDGVVTGISTLTGSAIVDYPMPDFTPDASTINLDIYLDYLHYGYPKSV